MCVHFFVSLYCFWGFFDSRGPGVVGTQPVLQPNTGFEYTSACPLATPRGSMVSHHTQHRHPHLPLFCYELEQTNDAPSPQHVTNVGHVVRGQDEHKNCTNIDGIKMSNWSDQIIILSFFLGLFSK